MSSKMMLCCAATVAAVWGCKIDARDNGNVLPGSAGIPDVAGTYVAADSGHTLGKNWCYSGALVLDSTGHFGSVLTMCSDEGSPVTEHLKGTYHLKSLTTRASRSSRALKSFDIVLAPDGSHQTHSLRYDAGALRFDEPWWLGAGLRALEIPDPLLKKVADSAMPDSSGFSNASSTTALAGGSKNHKTPARKSVGKH